MKKGGSRDERKVSGFKTLCYLDTGARRAEAGVGLGVGLVVGGARAFLKFGV